MRTLRSSLPRTWPRGPPRRWPPTQSKRENGTYLKSSITSPSSSIDTGQQCAAAAMFAMAVDQDPCTPTKACRPPSTRQLQPSGNVVQPSCRQNTSNSGSRHTIVPGRRRYVRPRGAVRPGHPFQVQSRENDQDGEEEDHNRNFNIGSPRWMKRQIISSGDHWIAKFGMQSRACCPVTPTESVSPDWKMGHPVKGSGSCMLRRSAPACKDRTTATGASIGRIKIEQPGGRSYGYKTGSDQDRPV